MLFGKVVKAEATVERSELGKFVDLLQLLGVEYTIEPCYLDQYDPEKYGYKFLPPADGKVVKVQGTSFIFSEGSSFHINTKQFGPSGTLVLVQNENGNISFRKRYQEGEVQPNCEGFPALATQYQIYDEIRNLDTIQLESD